ncbi:MAG: lipoprotein-releasing ABC transporter permease subunit [Rickettsiales bacterium]|nr:lipoprotein-releasing ABC transporter permease subunit [Rickettsiales bacterium]
MLTAFERKVAWRYLRARREEGLISVIAFFSLIGIALGVATLIVVLSVMNGVRDEMIKSIIGLEGHISVYSNAQGLQDYEKLSQGIAAIRGVKTAMPKVEGQVMASYQGRATGAMVTGLRVEDLKQKNLLTSKMTPGSVEALGQEEGVVIGSRMAEKLGLQIGDEITLISPEGRATIAGLVPRVKAYPVVGLFTIGMFAYDNNLVVLPFKEAQVYFKLNHAAGAAVSLIEVMIDNPDQAVAIARSISSAFPGHRIYDWKSSNNQIFQAVLVQRNVMFLILMLIILVAAFNIISSLIMLVHEKGRDVAILRTMGARRVSIMRIFMTCGASVGVVGTAVGVALGLLIAFNTENIQLWLESLMGQRLFADELYFLSHLPSKVDGSEVLLVVVIAFALSFLATLYPAKRAAQLDPAEAVRYE